MRNAKHVSTAALVSVLFVALAACSGEEWPSPPSDRSSPFGGTSSGPGSAGAGSAGTASAGTASGGTTGGGSGGVGGSAPAAADPLEGKTTYAKTCGPCHGAAAEGGLGPNITGSLSAGIGGWDEAAFTRALRDAVDRDGRRFCSLMVPYSPTMLSDAQLKNLYGYLMSVSNETPTTGNGCP